MPLFKHKPNLIVAERFDGTQESAERLLALYPTTPLAYDYNAERLFLHQERVYPGCWIVTDTSGYQYVLSSYDLLCDYESV